MAGWHDRSACRGYRPRSPKRERESEVCREREKETEPTNQLIERSVTEKVMSWVKCTMVLSTHACMVFVKAEPVPVNVEPAVPENPQVHVEQRIPLEGVPENPQVDVAEQIPPIVPENPEVDVEERIPPIVPENPAGDVEERIPIVPENPQVDVEERIPIVPDLENPQVDVEERIPIDGGVPENPQVDVERPIPVHVEEPNLDPNVDVEPNLNPNGNVEPNLDRTVDVEPQLNPNGDVEPNPIAEQLLEPPAAHDVVPALPTGQHAIARRMRDPLHACSSMLQKRKCTDQKHQNLNEFVCFRINLDVPKSSVQMLSGLHDLAPIQCFLRACVNGCVPLQEKRAAVALEKKEKKEKNKITKKPAAKVCKKPAGRVPKLELTDPKELTHACMKNTQKKLHI